MEGLRVYSIQFDEKKNKGVYALSVVENPAMQDEWMMLSEDKLDIQFTAVDNEKKLLMGAAIIPNKRIYRNIGGNEFYVVFEEDVVEKIAHSFIKNGFQNNSSENHEVIIEGATVVQSWVVEDPVKDKSNLYGKSYEKGTWVVMMKVDNPDIWQKAKDNKLTGFSIEAGLGLKELNINHTEKMNSNEILKAIQDGFKALSKKEEIKLGEVILEDKKTVLMFDGDAPEVGKAIFIKPAEKDGEKALAPEGEYVLENGEKLYVDKDGAISEAPKEEKPEEVAAEIQASISKQFEEIKKDFETKLAEMKKEHDLALAKEKKKNEELEAKLEKIPANDEPIVKLQAIAEPKNKKQRLLNAVIAAQNSN